MPALAPVTECPSAEALTAFDRGALADPELDFIGAHLSGCGSCQRALVRLAPACDPLIVGIRRYVGARRVEPEFRPTVDYPGQPGALHDTAGGSTDPSLDRVTVARRTDTPSPLPTDPKPPQIDVPDGILAPSQAPDEIGRLSSYRVLRVLGRGGMGLVFAAEDTQLNRPVALKVMLRGADEPRNRERFLREARSAAALAHDNIVPVFQVGEDRGVLFIAMPLLKGESLQSRLTRETQLPLSDVLRIGRETAAGLAAAHAQGMVHRDIKPDNLWLEAGESSRVKILDFGLARGSDDANLTNPGGVIGTPAYMAPEQARGEEVDARADLFSLGAVLYRMATGRAAFRGKDVPALLHAVCYDEPRPPHELDASVPIPLSDLIMRLLDKTASKRPTAREVVAALAGMEESFRDTGSAGSSESWLAPAAVRVRPRRRWSVGIAVAVLALAAGAGVVIIEITGPDGKKTKLEVPDGSAVKIGPNGDTQVILPGAKAPQPLPPPPPRIVPAAKAEAPPAFPKELLYGLKRETFAGSNFEKLTSTHPDPVMQWAWEPAAQNPDAPANAFSVRWSGYLNAPQPGKYRMRFTAQGAVRVWLDGNKQVDVWQKVSADEAGEFDLTGKPQEVRIEYRSAGLKPSFGWLWTVPGGSERPVPASILFPTAALAEAAKVPTDPDERALWTIRGDGSSATAVAFSSDGTLAAFSNPNGSITVVDIRTKKEAGVLTGHPNLRTPVALAFAPNGPWLVSGGNDPTVRLWDLKSYTEVESWKWGDNACSISAVFSPDGSKFAACSEGGTVRIWDSISQKEIGNWKGGQVSQILGWADNGQQLIVTADDGVLRLREVTTGTEVRKYPPVLRTGWLQRALTGGRLLVGEPHDRGRLQLVDLDAEPAKRNLWTALPEAVQSVAVSADGRWAACTIGEEKLILNNKPRPSPAPSDAIILYHLPSGREVHRFVGHTNWVHTVAFSRDGRQLLSAGMDGTVRLWALPEWLFAK